MSEDPMSPDEPGGGSSGERRRALRAERDRQAQRDRPDGPPPPPALVRPYTVEPQDSALLLADAPATPAAGVPEEVRRSAETQPLAERTPAGGAPALPDRVRPAEPSEPSDASDPVESPEQAAAEPAVGSWTLQAREVESPGSAETPAAPAALDPPARGEPDVVAEAEPPALPVRVRGAEFPLTAAQTPLSEPAAPEAQEWSAFTPVIPPEPLRFDDHAPAAWERPGPWTPPSTPPSGSWMEVEEQPPPGSPAPGSSTETVWTAPQGLEPPPSPQEPGGGLPAATRYDDLGDDEWLQHLRGDEAAVPDGSPAPDVPAAHDDSGETAVQDAPAAAPAGDADVEPLTPPVGWARDLSQVDLFRSALEEAGRTPSEGVAPGEEPTAQAVGEDGPPTAEPRGPVEGLPDVDPDPLPSAGGFSLFEPQSRPSELEPRDEETAGPAGVQLRALPEALVPEVSAPGVAGPAADEPDEPSGGLQRDEPEPDELVPGTEDDDEDQDADRPAGDEPEPARAVEHDEAAAGEPERTPSPFAPPQVLLPSPVGDDDRSTSSDRPSFGRAPSQRLSEAVIRDEDRAGSDDAEPVRGTLAPVLRRSTERARYPTTTTPVIRPPVLPPPPPGEAPAASAPSARPVTWEQALAGDVVPGKKRRPKGVKRSKPRHESGGPGEEYKPVKPPPDRSLTLLVVAMLLVLVGLVAAAAWTFWPRTIGSADGGRTPVLAAAPRAVGGP